MTKQKINDRESNLNEISAEKPPTFIQVYKVEIQAPPSGAEYRKLTPANRVITDDNATEPTPRMATILRVINLPDRAIIKKLRRGIAGISPI
jgi:hypothetical protein